MMVAVELEAGSGADTDACDVGACNASDTSADTGASTATATESDGDGMGDTSVDDALGCSAIGAKGAIVSAEGREATNDAAE